jgi:biopolymer transport protein TolR
VAQIGGDDKKNVTVDLNIVPFIDLMSVCIIFLLITAVWTQVSMIQIGSSVYGKRNEVNPAEPPPRAEIAFRLDIVPSGYVINLGKSQTKIPKKGNQWDDAGLFRELRGIKEKYPDKNDAIVMMADELSYEDLIRGMDLLLNANFPEISVATGGAQ